MLGVLSAATNSRLLVKNSSWQRGLNRSTTHVRVPSERQSVFTSRRERSILWPPPVSAVWKFGVGDFLPTREAKNLCAPFVSV
ncbi:hypothetical protein TNCV_4967461 [Trichonephila clavipes]|nr:hypothetical protein TNCV_4967461 [Trichonephila clavipes]